MEDIEARVEDLTHDGLGVVKVDQRVYFVDGVLPEELIRLRRGKKRKGKFHGEALEIIEPSSKRITPACSYFGVCGGCSLQHVEAEAQRNYKEKILFDNLARIGKVEAKSVIPMLIGDSWHYRRKARLGVKFVPKKGGILVGFREKQSSFITSLQQCETLDQRISDLLPSLHELISNLSNNNRIPQIEVAAGNDSMALVLRHLEDLEDSDLEALASFSKNHGVTFYSQSKGPASLKLIAPENPLELSYRHDHFDVELRFGPLDFMQVNDSINQKLVKQAVEYLGPKHEDRILDLFCGLGNFTLPLARSGAQITGIEGDSYLVERGMSNAKLNDLKNVSFELLDLQTKDLGSQLKDQQFNKLLIDPPRSGAFELVTEVIPIIKPERIVYVSCNPATLARDADVLVNQQGYVLSSAGAIDMFPHTAHVESMAVFDRV
jgi:23S rRNA (uracil1939-C5)-methyltransferase